MYFLEYVYNESIDQFFNFVDRMESEKCLETKEACNTSTEIIY